MMNTEQRQKMCTGHGFVAALDQSGGSTPKALATYGIGKDAYGSEQEMFDLMHAMRTRIMTSPAFTGDRILAAILFEQTMDRQVKGIDTPTYLWETLGIVPFVKVDKGLGEVADGVQLMKPMPDLDALCERAVAKGVFGTKMRSVIKSAVHSGISQICDQQFDLGRRIGHHGLIPIIEPEVDIKAPDKQDCERILADELTARLDGLPADCDVMLKLTIPSIDCFYSELIAHPRVLRVVALSGGYSRDEANALLARNAGLIASFSRALTQGLSADQSDEEFNATLEASIQSIYDASVS